jgi:hypothetical protein
MFICDHCYIFEDVLYHFGEKREERGRGGEASDYEFV